MTDSFLNPNKSGKDKLRQEVEISEQGRYLPTAELKKHDQLTEINFIKKGSDKKFLCLQIKLPVFKMLELPFYHYLFQSLKTRPSARSCTWFVAIPKHKYRLGREWIESGLEEEDLEVLVTRSLRKLERDFLQGHAVIGQGVAALN